MLSLQGICMEYEQIETIRDWLKCQSIQDIQVFLRFANFYQRFIQGFNQIAAPLISMLKTIGVNLSVTNPELVDTINTVYEFGNSEFHGAKIVDKMSKSKSKNLVKPFLAKFQSSIQGSELGFLIPKAKQAFINL